MFNIFESQLTKIRLLEGTCKKYNKIKIISY